MATQSRDIAPNDWKVFFDRVSRHYKGRTVDVQRRLGEEGVHALARGLPFLGIVLEAAEADESAVEVIAGNEDGELVSHVVAGPQRVWMRKELNGSDNALGIESADGSTTIVEFPACDLGLTTIAGHPVAKTSAS